MRALITCLLLMFPLWAIAGPLVTETFSADVEEGSGEWALKFNTYRANQAVRIVDFAPWLDPGSDPAVIQFQVYRYVRTDPVFERWALVFDSGERTISAGEGFKPSPLVDLVFEEGQTFALGVFLRDESVAYAYDENTPEVGSWGTLNGSLQTLGLTYFPVSPLLQNRGDHAYYQQVTVEVYQDLDGDGYDERVDCDDTDPLVYPGAPERCNGNDDDCNGVADDNVVYVDAWVDADGDGYGDPDQLVPACNGIEPGFADNPDDCDDSDPFSYPGAPERCDGADNDCDGVADNDVVYTVWYRDADGDGYGDPEDYDEFCADPPPGYVENPDDCDDGSATTYPGAPELCDGVDNNCDGEIDVGIEYTDWYADRDQDGYGDPAEVLTTCDGPPAGYVGNAEDCDDSNATVYPGAPELCDGLDNDCDGIIEGEGDSDGDGALDCEDCAPDDPEIYPGAEERCDGVDRDCDGIALTSHDCDPYGGEELALSRCGCQVGSPGMGGVAGMLALLGFAGTRRGRTRRLR